jgi:predicted phosphodiesterase
MTKLAVLSDIHGVWPALKAVEADLARFDVDQVVVLGDAVPSLAGRSISRRAFER